jgi:hypothetical protein
MEFPAFADYHDVFSSPLAPTVFTTYTPPSWIPEPQALLRIAMAVYPHWKERRVDRGGHRIIPTLNVRCLLSQTSMTYLCFDRVTSLIPLMNPTSVSEEEKSKRSAKQGHHKRHPPTNLFVYNMN